ncbi:MAG TPA: hypothetical protein VLI05_06715 [Candidatus Saccharimonadia bacterium]|nr:hypothetical protein [Candidatus Saccharimonadia bacterium]
MRQTPHGWKAQRGLRFHYEIKPRRNHTGTSWLLRQFLSQRPAPTGATMSSIYANTLIDQMITARLRGDYEGAQAHERQAKTALSAVPDCTMKRQLQLRLWRDGAEWRRHQAATLCVGPERTALLDEADERLRQACNGAYVAYAYDRRLAQADLGASLGMRARLYVTQGNVLKALALLTQVKTLLFWAKNQHYRLYHGLDYNELYLYVSGGQGWQLWRLWPSLLANLVRSVRYGQQQPRLHTVRALGHIVLALMPADYRQLLMRGEAKPANFWLSLLPEEVRPQVLGGTLLMRSLPELAPEPTSSIRPDHPEAT